MDCKRELMVLLAWLRVQKAQADQCGKPGAMYRAVPRQGPCVEAAGMAAALRALGLMAAALLPWLLQAASWTLQIVGVAEWFEVGRREASAQHEAACLRNATAAPQTALLEASQLAHVECSQQLLHQ